MVAEQYLIELTNGKKFHFYTEEDNFLENYIINRIPFIQDFCSSRAIMTSAIVQFEYLGTEEF